MLQQLSLEDFLDLANTAPRVAVYKEIQADRLTLIGVAQQLTSELEDGAILESKIHQHPEGRYSFISFGAIAELRVQEGQIYQRIGAQTTRITTAPLNALRQLLAQMACAAKPQQVDFINGSVGFMTYDAIRLFEAIPDRHRQAASLPEMLFKFYQTTLMFDHQQQKILISHVVDLNGDLLQLYQDSIDHITALIRKITQSGLEPTTTEPNVQDASPENVDISDHQFMQLVERAKDYIVKGDVFQVVLSRCFTQPYTASPFDIYRALRLVSPAPYMFYFPTAAGVIVGASPEKLISVHQGEVEAHPIAGTRQRGENTDDSQTAKALLADDKERAEHMMLVDLARNDLGAVCEPGTVDVKELLHVKHFSHVSHLRSAVTGRLRQDKDALDALVAAFPAGTVSGAPKIRAMQVIDELETSQRGLYGGALCRLDYQGNLDSCIAIRMAVLKEGQATIRTGAGIVYDSNPFTEAMETRHKARGVLAALALAEEGLA